MQSWTNLVVDIHLVWIVLGTIISWLCGFFFGGAACDILLHGRFGIFSTLGSRECKVPECPQYESVDSK